LKRQLACAAARRRISSIVRSSLWDRRAADRLRAERLDLGVFVGQHDAGVADTDLGMMDLAAGIVHAHHLGGAERLFVKGDRIAGGL